MDRYAESFRTANELVNEGMSWSGHERNACFLNTGPLPMANVAGVTGLDFDEDGRAVGVIDWDRDGDLDLIQVNRTAPQLRMMRNDWGTSQGHWLQLRLVGTRSNRDGVGARVQLFRPDTSGIDLRTVRAGSSFLSQSSKWLHFAWRADPAAPQQLPCHVMVTWPNGQRERFDSLVPGRFYRLVEGSGMAEAVDRPAASQSATANHVAHASAASGTTATDKPAASGPSRNGSSPSEQSEAKRLILPSPLPLPELSYTTFQGEPRQIAVDKPTLVQLWASWCPICRGEMTELVAAKQQLADAGLDVLSLCVDGIGADQTPLSGAPTALVELNFPYAAGRVSEAALRKLEVLRGELLSNSRPLPVPSSLLLDERGELVALYVGRCHMPQLLTDMAILRMDARQRRAASVPFPGRWFTPPRPPMLAPLAATMERAGFSDDAKRYRLLDRPMTALRHCSMALDAEREGKLKEAAAHYRTAVSIAPKDARVLQYVGRFALRRGDGQTAAAMFREAIASGDGSPESYYHLGTAYLLSGENEQAKQAFERVLQFDPRRADAHAALGRLELKHQHLPAAERHLRAAVAADPQLAPAHAYLGLVLAAQEKWSASAAALREALRLQPTLLDARERLADVLVRQGALAEAVTEYARVVQQNPRAQRATQQLAWYLATIPNKYPPDTALTLARRVAQASPNSAVALDTLAAAQANAGQHAEAVITAGKALRLAGPASDLGKAIAQRIAVYRAGRAYRLPLSDPAHEGLE